MTDTATEPAAIELRGIVKRYGDNVAVAGIDLDIPVGTFYGLLGPNGAGKTATLSIATGLLRPDAGRVLVHGIDVWAQPLVAKRMLGVLADGVDLFDRLTGEQLLVYTGLLYSLPRETVVARTAELIEMLDLGAAAGTAVADYSAGMTKKIALACALIHSPRVLVLDEPFESVDPVSAANVIEILRRYVSAGGTVVLSSHTMNLIERVCDYVAIVVNGSVLSTGTMAEVRGKQSLEDRFVELAGGRKAAEGLEWLSAFSD